jgi:hypothetical protein
MTSGDIRVGFTTTVFYLNKTIIDEILDASNIPNTKMFLSRANGKVGTVGDEEGDWSISPMPVDYLYDMNRKILYIKVDEQ